jgi:flagellar basal body-associated protein FliL
MLALLMSRLYWILLGAVVVLAGIAGLLYVSVGGFASNALVQIKYPNSEDLTGYAVNRTTVYFNGEEIPGADPMTFVVYDALHQAYAKDANAVYFGTDVVEGADPATFGASDIFGGDATHVYRAGIPIEGVDLQTFEALSVNYSRDANHVYYIVSILEGADSETFEVLNNYSAARDKNYVYESGEIVPDADPETYVAESD